jgi:hypothetical protein
VIQDEAAVAQRDKIRRRGQRVSAVPADLRVSPMEFKDVLTDPGQFRELMGEPPPPCVAKTMAMADQHCRACTA